MKIILSSTRDRPYAVDDLIACGTFTKELAGYLGEQIRIGKTLLISGGTGSGKTPFSIFLLRLFLKRNASSHRGYIRASSPKLNPLVVRY
jgi:Flp pilus assembly CpaF family ATPase